MNAIMDYMGLRFQGAMIFLSPALILGLLSGCLTINRTREELLIPQGAVVFSFDDGPNVHKDTTARLLEVLDKYDVRALFVLLGENAENSPELVRRIREGGHLILNHGYSDKWAVFMGAEEFTANLIRGEEAINAALGEDLSPRLYRPQGGMYKTRHRSIWRARGYTLVPSTVRAYDAVETGASRGKIVRKIIKTIVKQGGGVILLHDARDSHIRMEKYLAVDPDGEFDRSWIPGAVEEIILLLLKQGYRINGFDPGSLLHL
jgi:peptidoglycan/xylan/chitin deacetylase (PgdA/CDA1 family)